MADVDRCRRTGCPEFRDTGRVRGTKNLARPWRAVSGSPLGQQCLELGSPPEQRLRERGPGTGADHSGRQGAGPWGRDYGVQAPLEKGVAPGWGLCRGTIYTGREDGFLSPLAWPCSSRRGSASGRAGARTPTPLPWLPVGTVRGRDGTRPRVWRPGVHGPDGAGSVARAVGAESGGAGDGLAMCVQKGGRGRPACTAAAWTGRRGIPQPGEA